MHGVAIGARTDPYTADLGAGADDCDAGAYDDDEGRG
jgi:hypothetical protein